MLKDNPGWWGRRLIWESVFLFGQFCLVHLCQVKGNIFDIYKLREFYKYAINTLIQSMEHKLEVVFSCGESSVLSQESRDQLQVFKNHKSLRFKVAFTVI